MENSLTEESFDMVAKTWLYRGVPSDDGLTALMEELKGELKLDALSHSSRAVGSI
jgi:hypothetical protein